MTTLFQSPCVGGAGGLYHPNLARRLNLTGPQCGTNIVVSMGDTLNGHGSKCMCWRTSWTVQPDTSQMCRPDQTSMGYQLSMLFKWGMPLTTMFQRICVGGPAGMYSNTLARCVNLTEPQWGTKNVCSKSGLGIPLNTMNPLHALDHKHDCTANTYPEVPITVDLNGEPNKVIP